VSLIRPVLALAAAVAVTLACTGPAAAYESHLDVDYDRDGVTTPLNRLDLYAPEGLGQEAKRPLVVYVHGGGWMRGDKRNRIADKARLFTDLGYIFASVNYRLSPDPPDTADAARIRFPAQPADLGEALGWLNRHGDEFGANPRTILLIGHSAGAQIVSLVATDPSYAWAASVAPWQIVAAVSLDTDAFDIAEQATQEANPQNRALIWNAFATPAENAVAPVYQRASALNAADPKDPEMLLVTGTNPSRIAANRAMASALGQGPGSVLSLPYTHEQMNTELGSATDEAGETRAVAAFLAEALAAARPPHVRFTHTPRKRVDPLNASVVRFRFAAKPRGSAGGFECRLGGQRWELCDSPAHVAGYFGRNVFRVRALSERGRPGPIKSYTFRVKRR